MIRSFHVTLESSLSTSMWMCSMRCSKSSEDFLLITLRSLSSAERTCLESSSPPILFRLAPHRRCRWVLELEPVGRTARTIAGAEPLGHTALAAERAGVLKHYGALRVLQMLVQPHSWATAAQEARERRL